MLKPNPDNSINLLVPEKSFMKYRFIFSYGLKIYFAFSSSFEPFDFHEFSLFSLESRFEWK